MPKYNAKVKKPGSALSSIWPKMAINLVNEDLHYLLASASSVLPTTDDFVIVEPLFEGWGTEGKESLYAPGIYVNHKESAGPTEPITVELESTVWNTSMGATSTSLYNVDAPTITGVIEWESTNITYPEGTHPSGQKFIPYGNTYTRLWPTASVKPGFILQCADGSSTNVTTGARVGYLENENGVPMIWDKYRVVGEKSILYPGVVVLDTKIIGIVKLCTVAEPDMFNYQYTYEIYQWDRNGKFIDRKPIGEMYNYYELVDVSETDMWIGGPTVDSVTMGLIYRVHSDDAGLTVTEVTGETTDLIRRVFYKYGKDSGTRKFCTRSEDGFAYAHNAGQGLFKLDAEGVVWHKTEAELAASTNWATTPVFFAFVGTYADKVFCSAYASGPDDLRIFEVDPETGTVLRVTANCSINTESDSYLYNILINKDGILCGISYTGLTFVNLNTMTHIVSRYCTDEGLNNYESIDFVDGDGNFWFLNDSGSVILKVSADGQHCDYIFLDTWWGANGATIPDFVGFFNFPTHNVYNFSTENSTTYPAYFDIGWNVPFVSSEGLYILALVKDTEESPRYMRYFRLVDGGLQPI